MSHVMCASVLFQVVLLRCSKIAQLAFDFAFFFVLRPNVLEEIVRFLRFVRTELTIPSITVVRVSCGMNDNVSQQSRLKRKKFITVFHNLSESYLGSSLVGTNFASKALLFMILPIMCNKQLLCLRLEFTPPAFILFRSVFRHMSCQCRFMGTSITAQVAPIWPLLCMNPLMEFYVVLDTACEIAKRAFERFLIAMLRADMNVQPRLLLAAVIALRTFIRPLFEVLADVLEQIWLAGGFVRAVLTIERLVVGVL